MEKLFFILFVAMSITAQGQIAAKKSDTIKIHINQTTGWDAFTVFCSNHWNGLKYSVEDSARGTVAYQVRDSAWVILDSAATIRVLLLVLDLHRKQQERASAAFDILNYVRVDGAISNRKKFDAAVKKFQKLNK